jgi:hypothetical protein
MTEKGTRTWITVESVIKREEIAGSKALRL